MTELKPCPFCGSNNIKAGGAGKIVGCWCTNCQAAGPNQYGTYEWNDRADLLEAITAEELRDAASCADECYGSGERLAKKLRNLADALEGDPTFSEEKRQ